MKRRVVIMLFRSTVMVLLSASLILTFFLSAEVRAQSLADPGFENFPIGTDFSTSFVFTPNTLTTWAIDSAIVAGLENGISQIRTTRTTGIHSSPFPYL